jgi:hypothetical protein
MTDAAYSHFAILADRSGSMGDKADPGSGKTKAELAVEGIRRLIAEQAAQPGRATFSLVQFDTNGTDRVAWFVPGDDPVLAAWVIVPRSGTNLLDAAGAQITETGEHLAALPEDQRPGRVYFVIGTDGEENSSVEYGGPDGKARIAAKIAHQRDAYGWDFVFIGADFDAFAEAGGMGIAAGATLSSAGANIGVAYASTSDAISRSRASGQSVSYSDDERERAAGSA